MIDQERAMRIAVVAKTMAAFGDVSDEQVKSIVDLTSEIPWYVPPLNGEAPTHALLFASAVRRAALSVTFGMPKPADMLEAAISIAGKIRSDQGHETDRRWVKAARVPEQALPMPLAELQKLPLPAGVPIRAIGKGA